MPEPLKTILVIEDHAMISSFVARVAAEVFPAVKIEIAREGGAGLEACQRLQPDLVLLDLELPDGDGFDLVQRLRDLAPAARVLVLSAHIEPYILHRVHQAKVEGFVDKNNQTPETLGTALRTIAEGRKFFSEAVSVALANIRTDPQSFTKVLSEREQELLRLMGRGESDQAIADLLKLSQFTVKNHRRNIMAKVGVHSTPELIRYAIEHGFARMRSR
jgi:DNA-binding NarL/FixJ family response regulator